MATAFEIESNTFDASLVDGIDTMPIACVSPDDVIFCPLTMVVRFRGDLV